MHRLHDCFGQAENPPNTVLTNEMGEHVTMWSWGCSNNGDECSELGARAECEHGAWCGCTCLIIQLGGEGIYVPDDVLVNSDCEMFTAMVTWDPGPYFWSECGREVELDCFGVHDPLPGEPEMPYEYIQGLIEGGGEFAQGVTTFCCSAPPPHGCHGEEGITECWTVEVTDQNSMDVIVQYSPEMTTGPYVRCIYFWLFMDCYHDPILVMVDLVFGPPFEFVGKATEVLKVPKGQYDCVAAKDPLHTLRSTDGPPILCVGNSLVVEFHGDPLLGGNWLINGNLDCNDHIDIVDFGLFLFQFGGILPVDTPCGTPQPHADFNGDGFVNALDFAFIAMNFMEESKDACCDDPTSGWRGEPTYSITLKDLRLRGLGHLAVADLNGDGVLDQEDMVEFMNGSVPDMTPVREVKRGVDRSVQ